MCHSAIKTCLWLRTCTVSKIQFLKDTDEVFEDILQKAKTGNVTNKDLENIQQRTFSNDQRYETSRLKNARTEENMITVDKNGKLTKPQRPETNARYPKKQI